MQILKEHTKRGLTLTNNTNVINDLIYRKLLEASVNELVDLLPANLTPYNNTKPDVIKELHAAFLTSIAEFARANCSKEEVHRVLLQECNFIPNRADIYTEIYEKAKLRLQIKLGNIGTHLPHIVDVEWKIDYIVKTSVSDESEGPIFRVNLVTEEYDPAILTKKVGNVRFSCDSHELQDLVYKLKDAARHCHKIASEH